MPDELYILLVSERENEVYSHECPFDTILVTGTNNMDILGRYCAKDVIGDDCLLHYRKYIKDKKVTGGICMVYEHQEDDWNVLLETYDTEITKELYNHCFNTVKSRIDKAS